MPRLFVALPVPEEIADELAALQSGVPDAHWQTAENLHVTLCFCGEVQGAVMRDLEEELSDIAGPRFSVTLASVGQFSTGKQPRALVALVEKNERLDWLQQKVSTVARNVGIEIEPLLPRRPRLRAQQVRACHVDRELFLDHSGVGKTCRGQTYQNGPANRRHLTTPTL